VAAEPCLQWQRVGEHVRQPGDVVDGGIALPASAAWQLYGAHLDAGRQHHCPPAEQATAAVRAGARHTARQQDGTTNLRDLEIAERWPAAGLQLSVVCIIGAPGKDVF